MQCRRCGARLNEIVSCAAADCLHPAFGWKISEETQRQLDEIEVNIRAAFANAKNVIFD